MSIMVYHAKEPKFFVRDSFIRRPSVEAMIRDYKDVAKVDSDNLDEAFMLTNTINAPWWENGKVEFRGSPDHGMEGCRSTSVGDLMVREEADGEYVAYVVCGIGFRRLTV